MMLYIRKRVVVRESVNYQSKKNARLDVFANIAVQKLASAIRFKAADKMIMQTSDSHFEPIRGYKPAPSLPYVEELAADACTTFIERLSFAGAEGAVSESLCAPLGGLYEHHNPGPRASALAASVGDVAEAAGADAAGEARAPSYRAIARPLIEYSQDCQILRRAADVGLIIGQAALGAVGGCWFGGGVARVGANSRGALRALLRMAYPRWDNEDPLELSRAPTLDELELDADVDAAAERALRGGGGREPAAAAVLRGAPGAGAGPREGGARRMRFDLSSILGGLDSGMHRMLEPIPRLAAHARVFSRERMWAELSAPVAGLAAAVAGDPEQRIYGDDVGFVRGAVRASLAEFVAEAAGASAAAVDAVEAAAAAGERAAAAALALLSFGHLGAVGPFLDGCAKSKRHKHEDPQLRALKKRRRMSELPPSGKVDPIFGQLRAQQ